MTSTWRQILKLKNLDACDAFKGTHPVELANQYMKFMSVYLPNLIPDACPVKPHKYFVNHTITSVSIANNFTMALTPEPYPNGRYRIVLRFHNQRDPIGVTFWVMIEYYYWNNEATQF